MLCTNLKRLNIYSNIYLLKFAIYIANNLIRSRFLNIFTCSPLNLRNFRAIVKFQIGMGVNPSELWGSSPQFLRTFVKSLDFTI